MRESQKFAYGKNHVDGCPCPATAAGYSPTSNPMALLVAEQYDEQLKESSSDNGTVDEKTAKETWKAAIEYYQRTAEQIPDQGDKDWYQERADVGKEIARELGWME